MKTVKTILLLAALVGAPLTASAHDFRGDNELSGMVGGQIGIHDSPGGGMLASEYAHRLSQLTWFDLQLDLSFGGDRDCFINRAGYVDCGAYGGQSLSLVAGAKWKFQTRNERLVPYAKVGGGLAFLFWPGRDNDGVAPIVRGGGGLKYFVLPNLGLGGEASVAFGPGIYDCGPSCTTTDLYFAWSLLGGVEFDF